MAVTEIHAIRTTLNKALDYIMNPKKTDDRLLVDGFGCSPETAALQFELTKKNFLKEKGILGFHIIQSFSPREVDYETAHKIGMELAEKSLTESFNLSALRTLTEDTFTIIPWQQRYVLNASLTACNTGFLIAEQPFSAQSHLRALTPLL